MRNKENHMETKKCEYCSGKPLIDRKPLMRSGEGDYTVFINSCNYLEDSEVLDCSKKFSLYGVKINFCPVCGRKLS
jgi:DNA-directed RNA polymerase subunit RPC12/RpoP